MAANSCDLCNYKDWFDYQRTYRVKMGKMPANYICFTCRKTNKIAKYYIEKRLKPKRIDRNGVHFEVRGGGRCWLPLNTAYKLHLTEVNNNLLKESNKKRCKRKIQSVTSRYCTGCDMDIENNEELVILHKTRRQSHGMCSDCMINYLSITFKDRCQKIKPSTKLLCCGNGKSQQRDTCSYKLELRPKFMNMSTTEIKIQKHLINLIQSNEELRRLYHTMLFLADPNAAYCINSKCSEIITDIPINQKHLICPYCQYESCHLCKTSPYHYNRYCDRNDILNAIDDDDTKKQLLREIEQGITKLCPSCNAPTKKNRGCNKMTCTVCDHKWCWLCNEANIDLSHFNSEYGSINCRGRLFE